MLHVRGAMENPHYSKQIQALLFEASDFERRTMRPLWARAAPWGAFTAVPAAKRLGLSTLPVLNGLFCAFLVGFPISKCLNPSLLTVRGDDEMDGGESPMPAVGAGGPFERAPCPVSRTNV